MNERLAHKDHFVVSTGVDGDTGRLLLPPLSPEQLGRLVAKIPPDESLLRLLQDWSEGKEVRDPFRAPSVDIEDPTDLGEAGWGIIFAENTPDEVRRALSPLIERRREQVKDHFFEMTFESKASMYKFMSRVKFKPGTRPTPDKLPFYILLVGDPAEIPFSVQSELDVQFAVGRLHFDPEDPESPESVCDAYQGYANAVEAAEDGRHRRREETVFFSVENLGDEGTRRLGGELVDPLVQVLQRSRPTWRTGVIGGADATREGLGRLLSGSERRPSILFTTSHGLGFRNGNASQSKAQGALICRDWSGRPGTLERGHYFTGSDVPQGADLTGLVAFHFACYSAGTPQFDEFGKISGVKGEIAPRPFVSRLSQTFLKRGALAVVGHVDRAWTSSFSWNGEGGHVQIYSDILKQLMDGMPVGWAMESMGSYFGSLAASLHKMREDLPFGRPEDYAIFADLWRETNDAANFVVLGDPAVRLNFD